MTERWGNEEEEGRSVCLEGFHGSVRYESASILEWSRRDLCRYMYCVGWGLVRMLARTPPLYKNIACKERQVSHGLDQDARMGTLCGFDCWLWMSAGSCNVGWTRWCEVARNDATRYLVCVHAVHFRT